MSSVRLRATSGLPSIHDRDNPDGLPPSFRVRGSFISVRFHTALDAIQDLSSSCHAKPNLASRDRGSYPITTASSPVCRANCCDFSAVRSCSAQIFFSARVPFARNRFLDFTPCLSRLFF